MHPRRGGAETLVEGIAKRLAADGREVTFFAAHVGGLPSEEEVDGIRYVRRGNRYGVYAAAYQWLTKVRPDYDLLVDHINTVPFFTPLFERHRNIAFVHQLAKDVWWYEASRAVGALGFCAEFAYLKAYKTTPAITVSASTLQDLRSYGWAATIQIIREPVPPPPAILPPKCPYPSIIFVGRLTPSKRVEHAVAAFGRVRQRYPNAKMAIVGEGDDPKYIHDLQRIARIVGGVEFLGRLNDAERQRCMAESHLLFSTSVREGWCLVVTEANSVGTPAIGYDVPGLRDSIKPGCGVLVPSGSSDAMGTAAIEIFGDSERYARMRDSALADGRQYSWQVTYEDFKEAVRRLRPAVRL